MKSIVDVVNPFDVTLYALPSYLVVVGMVYLFRADKVKSIDKKMFIKISVITLVGALSMYLLRYAQKLSKNPGFPSAIAAVSIIPITLMAGSVNTSSLAGILLVVAGISIISIFHD